MEFHICSSPLESHLYHLLHSDVLQDIGTMVSDGKYHPINLTNLIPLVILKEALAGANGESTQTSEQTLIVITKVF